MLIINCIHVYIVYMYNIFKNIREKTNDKNSCSCSQEKESIYNTGGNVHLCRS